MDNKLIDFNERKLQNDIEERFILDVTPIIANEEVIEYVTIFQTQKNCMPILSDYSNYFTGRVLSKSLTNSATNTKVNSHGKFIVNFLNYIFYESENKITSIEELDRKLIIEFLSNHAKGLTGNQKGKWVSKETSVKAGMAIMRFVYWLKYGYNSSTNEATLKMSKIKKSDFDISSKVVKKRRTLSDGSLVESEYIEKKIECPSDFKKTSKHSGKNQQREKVVELGLYTIKILIDVAKKRDNLMVFPIVLGAFAGLRQGDVVQMNRERINLPDIGELTKGGRIDLWDEVQVSNKIKDSGKIKIHRIQPIYEAFMPIIINSYQNHLKLLKSRKLDSHKYGALFFNNRNDEVMKQSSLNRRFKAIVSEAITILRTDALEKNNEFAITEYNIISSYNYKITFHSLRYFYTQMLEELEYNPFVIAYYRGDNAVESQNTYRGNMSTVDTIKIVLDRMDTMYEKYGFKL